MKITKVDVMLINPKAEDNKPWTPVGIRIYTDAGIYGDGEAAMAYGSISRGASELSLIFQKRLSARTRSIRKSYGKTCTSLRSGHKTAGP